MNKKQDFINTIRECEGILYKISRIYSEDLIDRQDLYQDIVYQLWKSFDSFKGDSKISTWVYRVALNTSISHLERAGKRRNKVQINEDIFNLFEETDQVMDERVEALYNQIKKLDIIEKGIILLYLDGKSYDEIAIITGFSVTNVGTRLNRIKNKLREQFKV